MAQAMVAVVLGLTACGVSGSSAGAQTDTRFNVQLRFTPSVQFAASYAATDLGCYKSQGLDVTIRPGGTAISVEPLLVQGTADIGLSAPGTTARSIRSGAQLTIVAAAYQKAAGAIISLAKNPLNTPAELRGKKIGVPAMNTSVERFLAANGLKRSDVKIVPIQGDAGPLISGQADATYGAVTNQVIPLQLGGYQPVVMKYADFGMNGLDLTYTVATANLKDPQKRAEIVKFLRAEIKGWQKIVADPQYAADLMVNKYGKSLGLNAAEQLAAAKAQVSLIKPTEDTRVLTMSPAAIQETIETLAKENITANTSMFDPSLINEAYQNLGGC